MRIHVRFQVPAMALRPGGARVTVGMQDVGRADADALTLSEETFLLQRDDEAAPGDETTVEVDLIVPRPDARSSCTVRVHVDVTGSGDLSSGDLLSTSHVPVSAADEDGVIVVPLERLA